MSTPGGDQPVSNGSVAGLLVFLNPHTRQIKTSTTNELIFLLRYSLGHVPEN
jgi:hypothetical protein